jgi:hypothetical protein
MGLILCLTVLAFVISAFEWMHWLIEHETHHKDGHWEGDFWVEPTLEEARLPVIRRRDT